MHMILNDKNFKSSQKLQRQIHAIVDNLLRPWQGPNAVEAMTQYNQLIMAARAAHLNTTFGFYVSQVQTVLKA